MITPSVPLVPSGAETPAPDPHARRERWAKRTTAAGFVLALAGSILAAFAHALAWLSMSALGFGTVIIGVGWLLRVLARRQHEAQMVAHDDHRVTATVMLERLDSLHHDMRLMQQRQDAMEHRQDDAERRISGTERHLDSMMERMGRLERTIVRVNAERYVESLSETNVRPFPSRNGGKDPKPRLTDNS